MINTFTTRDQELIQDICIWRSALTNAVYSFFNYDPVDVAFYEEELSTYKYFDV